MSVSPESQTELIGRNLNCPIAGKSDAGVAGVDTQCKKRTNSTRDRLSELPDLALVHILSHLYTEEAARASVLSKRFSSLWNSVDSLRFSDKYSGKDGVVFISIVDTALRFHRRKCIENFSLTLDYNFTYKAYVDQWINFAVEKQVKSLHLIFNEKVGSRMPRMPDLRYTLPKILYKNETLVELVTYCCDFSMETKISCSRLKFLSITQASLTAKMISRILHGCTVLETLELRDYTGFDMLKIDSSSLRVLRIVGEQIPHYLVQPGDNCVLEISGPNLVSLEVSGVLYRTKLRLTDVGSLVNAVMSFTVMCRAGYGSNNLGFTTWVEEICREVLESLCLVKVVTIGGSIMKALSRLEAYNLSSPWSERRSLTLCVPVTDWIHLGIGSLLYSSPYLESLVIRTSYCSDTCVIEHADSSRIDNEMHYWKSWSTISKCPLLHLRTVKVVGFQVSCRSIKPLFLFLEFLLTNSKVLEELVIQASRYVPRAALNEAMKLLDVRTASPDVVVQFEPPHFWVDPLCMYQETFPPFPTQQT